MKIEAIVSRFFRTGQQAQVQPRATELQSIATAQVEPPYVETSRAGRRFVGGTQIIANGIAPVAAIPTTTATLALYNNDSANNGLTLVLDWLNVFLGSGTPAAGMTVFAAVFKPTTAPSANATGYGSSSASGSSRSSKGIWTTALTAPAGANWLALTSSFQAAAANVGQGDNFVDFAGRLLVPPGQCLGFGILSGAGTTPLYGVSAAWSELELDLE